MLKKVTEEKLKELGFERTAIGRYRKYYPSDGKEDNTKFMYAEVTQYWFDGIQGYSYALGDEFELWSDEFVFKLGEKDDPRKACEAIEKGFAEWKKDLKELRRGK